MVALYYDDAELVPAAELRADAGVVVRDGTVVPAGLHLVCIPAGVYASTLHQGPYDRLADAWTRFMGGWLVSSGHSLGGGPCYERYLNTPMNAAPNELRTELFLPLGESETEADSGEADAGDGT
jgi:AraC family transcriptional regulator